MCEVDVTDQIAKDCRVNSYTHYEDENVVYLRVYDNKAREAVKRDYAEHYNVDVRKAGLQIRIEW